MTTEETLLLLAAVALGVYLYRQKQAEAAPGVSVSAFSDGGVGATANPAAMVTDAGTSLGAVLQSNADEFRALLSRLGF